MLLVLLAARSNLKIQKVERADIAPSRTSV